MQIDHIAIWTTDLEKEKDFYMKYFNCTVNKMYQNPKKQFSSYFISFTCGARIELMKGIPDKKLSTDESLGITHFAINVGTREKVDTLTKKIDDDGFTIAGYPRVTGDGYYESVILDSENNRVELVAMDDYEINEAELNDLEDILYLQKCCYLQEAEIYNNYSIQPITQSSGEIKLEFEKQLFLKLVMNNKIVGSVRGFQEGDTCYIGKLIVNRDFQNKGFGKLLMLAIENRFKQVNRFELFTGFNSSKNLYLYHELGYKEFKSEEINGTSLIYLEKTRK